MLTKEMIIERLREDYSLLADRYDVERIGLFGSFAAGTATEDSDVDLVVEFRRPIGFGFISLVEHLERLLGRKVDLLTVAGLQSVRVPDVTQGIEETLVYVEPF
jgi:uncharacterized protein